MTRRQAFREADVSRALRAAQSVGLAIGRVEIDQDGKIVIVSARPETADCLEDPNDALAALRRRNAERRSKRVASR